MKLFRMQQLACVFLSVVLVFHGRTVSGQADSREAGPIAVSVARTTSVEGPAFPVEFHDVVVDQGGAWDPTTNTIKVPQDSIFFFHLNAGANAGERINMNLRGVQNHADVLRTSTIHDGQDTIGRDWISWVRADSSVRVESNKDTSLYSEGDRHTSFSAFDITAFMADNPVIFSAGRGTYFYNKGTVELDEVFVNEGSYFSSNNFTVPANGIYVLTYNIGLRQKMHSTVRLTSDRQGRLTEIFRQNEAHEGEDSLGKLIIAEAVAGEVLNLELNSGEIYSDGEHQASFAGFLYEPRDGIKSAWSAFTNVSTNSSTVVTDPLAFQGTLVNTENIFNTTTNEVTIQYAGLYYVSVYLAMDSGDPLDAYLVRGRVRPEMNLYRSSTTHNKVDAVSQGMLLRLEEGETLRVVLDEGSMAYSDGDRQGFFSGFYLGP